MAEVFLAPKKFQGQIDAFQSGAESIDELKYNVDKMNVRLQSVDKYLICVKEFNTAMDMLAKLLGKDTESMKQIKAKWMNADSSIATKTFGEIISSK